MSSLAKFIGRTFSRVEIIDEKVLDTKTTNTVTIQAFDEEAAKREALSNIAHDATIESVVMSQAGKKGFLGFGHIPNSYEIRYSYPAFVAKVTYRRLATIRVFFVESANDQSTEMVPPVTLVPGQPYVPRETSAASTSQSISELRFVENAEGTITDTQTGLMWQKEDDAHLRRFTESEQYCRELILAGYRDWRLPTIDELRSVSSHWKQIFDRTKDDESYWSSTILENPHWSSGQSEAYRYAAKVLFSSGAENQYFLHYEYYTRAVRNML